MSNFRCVTPQWLALFKSRSWMGIDMKWFAVPAALNNPNISWITQVKQPPTLTWAIPVQPVTVQSVVRIKTNTATENKQLVEVLK